MADRITEKFRRKMTTKDFAKHFEMNESAIRKLLIKGKIDAEKIGRDWHIHPQEIDRWQKIEHGKKCRLVPRKQA